MIGNNETNTNPANSSDVISSPIVIAPEPVSYFNSVIAPHLMESCDSLLTKCESSIFSTGSCDAAYNICLLAVLIHQEDYI